MHSSTLVPSLAVYALALAPSVSAVCCPFGVDFHDGQTYFQNSLSTENFTWVSEFEGCENDSAQNVLIAPDGTQYRCTDTTIQPDDTPQLATCPIAKKDLFGGIWSLETISNNGEAEPIAKQRDVSLIVGPQITTTFTPTVTLTITTTPIINVTSINTFTSTTVLPPATVTKPSSTAHPTVTISPNPITTTKTKTLLTLTILKPTLSVKKTTSISTATCITPTRQPNPDPTATITPTVVAAAAFETAPSAKFRRNQFDHHGLFERAERFLNKRAPDAPTITVTDGNTAHFVTSTSTVTAPATTVTVISITTKPETSTPAPITVFNGVSSASVVTTTLPTVTKTKTKLVLFGFVTKAVTVTATVTIKTTSTPAAVAASCTSIGGKLS